MQTFVPLPDFADTMAVLDRRRLGKQRVETFQILATLLRIPTLDGKIRDGWRHHPAVKMWRGHEVSLARYGLAACDAWSSRGHQDNMWPAFAMITISARDRTVCPNWREVIDETVRASRLDSVRRTERWFRSLSEPLVDRELPPWWGRPDVHSSHRAMLRAKEPEWYATRLREPESTPARYVWPV